jgi:hypothetical protein
MGPEVSHSTNQRPPNPPQYNKPEHVIYDSLVAPRPVPLLSLTSASPSLPPPNSSTSSLVKPALPDSTYTSTGQLSTASCSGIKIQLRSPNSLESLKEKIRETRRLSSSVPDTLDRTIDFPLEFLEPISINKDLLELDEMSRAAGGHLVGHDQAGQLPELDRATDGQELQSDVSTGSVTSNLRSSISAGNPGENARSEQHSSSNSDVMDRTIDFPLESLEKASDSHLHAIGADQISLGLQSDV